MRIRKIGYPLGSFSGALKRSRSSFKQFFQEASENAELDIKELDKSNQSVRERMEQMVKEKSREAKREKSKKNKKRDSLKSTDQLTSDLTQEAVRSLSFDNGEDKTGDEGKLIK